MDERKEKMIGYLASLLWELTFTDERAARYFSREALQKIAEEFGGFDLNAEDILAL